MTDQSHKGLVKRKVTVKRGGKTFERYQWVKSGEDVPESKKGKKKDVPESKGTKSEFNIGDKINFMGENLSIEKVSESQKTIKLSDGVVYTFDAIKHGSGMGKNPGVKNLKVKKEPEKSPEKIDKIIPAGTLITPENLEETVQVGKHITLMGENLTVTSRNGSILQLFTSDNQERFGSTIGIMEMGATVREETPEDKRIKKDQDRKIRDAEKLVANREKRFGKPREIKHIGAKSGISRPEIGMKIDMGFGEKPVTSINSEGITIGDVLYDPDEVNNILSDESSLVTGDKVDKSYKITGDKKQDKKISDTINKLDNLMLDGKSLGDAAKEVIDGSSNMINTEFKIGYQQEKIKDGIDRASNYLSTKYKDKKLNLKFVESGSERSYAIPATSTVYLDDDYDIKSTTMHEIGHIIEENHAGNKKVIDDFLRSRTSNLSNSQKLNDLYPRAGYRDDEVACKDNFITPYIGKIYNKKIKSGEINTNDIDGTEIFSMGFQKFVNESEMKEFYMADKEHFAITLSIAAGDFL